MNGNQEMIAAKDNFPQLTPEEYFAWEEQQLEKHEYIDGEIYAMGDRSRNKNYSGRSKNHSLIVAGLTSLCFSHLRGSRCQTGTSDLRIKAVNSHTYTYADVIVTCDEQDKESTQFITYPCLIVEVLSKSTEAYDRGGKFKLYRQNPVLQDYLLVSSTSIEIDLYHKKDTGEWIIKNYQASDIVELKSINLSFPIEEVYRGLTLTEE